MENINIFSPFNVVALVCAIALTATVLKLWFDQGAVKAWLNRALFYDVTLDDVMKDPNSFFRNSEWHPIVADLVVEEAALRAMELTKDGWCYPTIAARQEAAIWDILNSKLQEK